MTVETAAQQVQQMGKASRAYKTVVAPRFVEYWHTRRMARLMKKF